MFKILTVIAIVALSCVLCKDPPVLGDSFQVAFDETFIQNQTKYRINGQWYYDGKGGRERYDRVNGRYDLFCGDVMPNVTTPCTQTTVGGKRYIIYPQKKYCCFCCDSAHGCGVLKQDWLEGADYLGTERLIDTDYDKWSKDGMFGYNHFWTNIDGNVPRRLDEDGKHLTDYLVHTYINKTFDESYFALPSYCGNVNCPLASICGKFRNQETELIYE